MFLLWEMNKIIGVIVFTFIIVNLVGFTVFFQGNQPSVNQDNNTNNSNNIINSSNQGNSTLPGISRAVLTEHSIREDCWIAYQGKVYDLTSWLPDHPGSAEAIAPFCGKAEEFENAFTGQHGTSQVERLTQEGIYKGELQ